MKSISKIALLVAFASLITTACGETAGSSFNSSTSFDGSSSISSDSSIKDDKKIKSLAEGLQFIYENKNYTIDVALNNVSYYSVFYNEKYVGTDSSGAATLDLKIFDGNGIYPLNYAGEEFVSGEYYKDETGKKYTELYDNSLVQTLYHIDEDFVYGIEDETKADIKGKRYRMQLIRTIGIDENAYISLQSTSVEYVDGTLVFTVSFGSKYVYTLTAHNFGTTVNKHYEQFIAAGGGMKLPSEDLQQMQTLLEMDNFRRYVYDFDSSGYTCFENFHEHYFYTQYFSTNDIYGYMSMNCTADEASGRPELKGCYYFYTEDGTPHFNSMAFNENPDIPMFFHYPKYLSLFENKLHLIVKETVKDISYSAGTDHYMIYDTAVIKDFAHNFSLDQSWDTSTYPPYGLGIEMKLDYKNIGNSFITFHYLFKYQGIKYDYPIPVYDFGKVSVAGLDTIYSLYNDR